MFGKPGSDPNPLTPLDGVHFELVRSADDGPSEGELVLIGNASATSGYLQLPSEKKVHRSLTGGVAGLTPQQRFATNDRFTAQRIDGEDWLLYLCRADDLLVHTSGEMSNPLPTEQQMIAECPSILSACCVVGTNMPRCMALLELAAGVDANDESVLSALRRGMDTANSTQPQYSRVLKQHALLVPPDSLPKTVKGTVQRSKAEALYAKELEAARQGSPISSTLYEGGGGSGGSGDGDGGGGGYDSTALTSSVAAAAPGKALEHISSLRFLGALHIVTKHMTDGQSNNTSSPVDADIVARIALCFFVTASGFGTHLTHSKEPLMTDPQLLVSYLTRRVFRFVFTAITAIFMLAVLYDAGSAQGQAVLNDGLKCIFTCSAFGCQDNVRIVLFWFVGAMIPVWLSYPLIGAANRFITHKLRASRHPHMRSMASYGPLAVYLVLWCAFYFPLKWDSNVWTLHHYSTEELHSDVFSYSSPLWWLFDYLVAVGAAEVALAHSESGSWRIMPLESHLRMIHHVLTYPRASPAPTITYSHARGLLADAVGLFLFLSLIGKPLFGWDTDAFANEHAIAPVWALFYYGSSADGGAGITVWLLARRSMSALGETALEVYCFQGGVHSGMRTWLGVESTSTRGFIIYVIGLWFWSWAFAEACGKPLTHMIGHLCDSYCGGGRGGGGCCSYCLSWPRAKSRKGTEFEV